MVWFFLIPSIPTVLGNFLVPLMIGARDVAFPRLNLRVGISSWRAGVRALVDHCWRRGYGLDVLYALSAAPIQMRHVIAMAAGIFIAGFGSILDRAEFHRHDPQNARAGTDLVSAAVVHLVASIPRASFWFWPPRCWRSRWR